MSGEEMHEMAKNRTDGPGSLLLLRGLPVPLMPLHRLVVVELMPCGHWLMLV